MPRNKPYYSKRQILNLISAGKVIVKYQAKESALNDFGWRREAIYKAISALTLKRWYKSELYTTTRRFLLIITEPAI